MVPEPDAAASTARAFIQDFGDQAIDAAVEHLTAEGREQVTEGYPAELTEGDLDAADVLEEYWWGLYGQYGEFDGVDVAHVDDGRVTAELRFAAGSEVATLEIGDAGVAGFGFDPAYEPPDYVDRDGFSEADVTVDAGDVALEGVLTIPAGEGPFPGVLLVHGHGLHDPDATAGSSKIHRDLAWGLASQGIASLRYAKRLDEHEVPDEAFTLDTVVTDDAVAALGTLADAEEVAGDAVVVAGHSQGGMVAPRIADRYGNAAGVVILDGPTDPVPDPDDADAMRYSMEVDGELDEEQATELEALRETFERVAAGDIEDEETIMGKPGVWHRSRRECDPAGTAAALDVPTFVLKSGRADEEVQPELREMFRENYEAWRDVDLPAGSRVEFYEAVDHYFQEGPTPTTMTSLYFGGNVAEYVVSDLVGWIDEVTSD